MKSLLLIISMLLFIIKLNAQQELNKESDNAVIGALNDLQSELNLDEDQVERISEILHEYRTDAAGIIREKPGRSREVNDDRSISNDGDLSSENRSEENRNYEQFSKDQNDNRMKDELDPSKDLADLQRDADNDIIKALTPEQKEKWSNIKHNWWRKLNREIYSGAGYYGK